MHQWRNHVTYYFGVFPQTGFLISVFSKVYPSFEWQIMMLPSISWSDCRSQQGQDQQLDRAHIRGSGWKFPKSRHKAEPAKEGPYLDAERAVAFTENHHLVGVDQLLYSGFQIVLPGFAVDGRHFEDNTTCLQRQASNDGRLEGIRGRSNHSSSFDKRDELR